MKHFIKTLALFTVMIALGMAGVYFVNNMEQQEVEAEDETQIQVQQKVQAGVEFECPEGAVC